MKRHAIVLLAAAAVAGVPGCAQMPPDLAKLGGWSTLIDGESGLENWHRVGDANWRAEDGAIVAYRGKGGFLVSKGSYKDFHLRAEFWAGPATNSGVFLRVSNPKRIGADTAYEVNILDEPLDKTYGTAAIVKVARANPAQKAGGKWNTLEVSAKGPELRVLLNGVETVNVKHRRFAKGPIALQYAAGEKNAEGATIKWRKVQVRPLEEAKPAASAPRPAAGGGTASKL
jgi:hypothetical protein